MLATTSGGVLRNSGADHPFALALRSGWITPVPREVRHQCRHLPTLVCVEHTVFASELTLVLLPGCGHCAQLGVPLRLPANPPPGGCRDRRGGNDAEQAPLRTAHAPLANVACGPPPGRA